MPANLSTRNKTKSKSKIFQFFICFYFLVYDVKIRHPSPYAVNPWTMDSLFYRERRRRRERDRCQKHKMCKLEKKEGVNFINVFTRSFYARRSQKRKKLLHLTIFFALLGSGWIKVAHKKLMKLTQGGEK